MENRFNMKTRTFGMLAAALLVIALSGCSGSKDSTTTTPNGTNAEANATSNSPKKNGPAETTGAPTAVPGYDMHMGSKAK